MASGNTVELVGNLARDPELRFTPSGQALASFGLAVNRRWQNRQTQEWEETVSFVDVTVWGQQAENVAQSLAKGSRVMVSGRFEQQSWEDKAGGGKRSKIVVIADEVAPSLRWATAAITRIERTDNNGGIGTPVRPAPTRRLSPTRRPATTTTKRSRSREPSNAQRPWRRRGKPRGRFCLTPPRSGHRVSDDGRGRSCSGPLPLSGQIGLCRP